MAITPGQQALASDFISTSAGSGSVGQVPKLNSVGKLDNSFLPVKFGGTGTDGALSISSGTTTINLSNATLVEKNYTGISVTGSGKLAFSNPNANGTIIVLKSQGDVTLTSSSAPMIDASGMGSSVGNIATWGGFIYSTCGGGGAGSPTGSAAAAGGGALTLGFASGPNTISAKYSNIFIGSGGGNGGAVTESGATASAGIGGVGGGCLIIECGGSLNFTTTNGISVAGIAGTNGAATGSSGGHVGAAGGGGGGGGGCCFLLYNSLTANTGNIIVSAGNGGTGQVAGSGGNACASGGGGGMGIAGGGSSSGAGPTSATSGAGGGTGYSLVVQNTDIA